MSKTKFNLLIESVNRNV